MTKQELIELLADREHASWARWMAYLFSRCIQMADGSFIMGASDVQHWQREIDTDYVDLPESAKQSDREEVAHILPIIKRWHEEQP
jgi:hypothetical protein